MSPHSERIFPVRLGTIHWTDDALQAVARVCAPNPGDLLAMQWFAVDMAVRTNQADGREIVTRFRLYTGVTIVLTTLNAATTVTVDPPT